LYSELRVENPYLQELVNLPIQFNFKETLLLKELIASITLVNKKSRESIEGKLITAREDVLNALLLLIPKDKKLNSHHAEALEKLRNTYPNVPFSCEQASALIGKSKRTIYRLMKLLEYHSLVEKLTNSRYEKSYFQVSPKKTYLQEEEKENAFEIAFEEYSDITQYYHHLRD